MTFEQRLAAHYGLTVEQLYHRVTGQPIWLDHGAKGQAAAAKKWAKFVDQCYTQPASPAKLSSAQK